MPTMSKKVQPRKRTIVLLPLDQARLDALKKHYATRLDLDLGNVSEQTVISWAIRDAAKTNGVEPPQPGGTS